MNDILKQRLVGALILIALGVVFWPIIFVEPGDNSLQDNRRIPVPPGVDTQRIAEPDSDGLRRAPELAARREARAEAMEADRQVNLKPDTPAKPAEAPGPTPSGQSDGGSAGGSTAKPGVATKSTPAPSLPGSRARSEAPVKPMIDAEGVPIAWILQVASVSKPEGAEQLRQRLVAMGHKAYIKKVRRGETTLLRVYIGPKFERAKLEKTKIDIDRQFGVTSMVIRYIP